MTKLSEEFTKALEEQKAKAEAKKKNGWLTGSRKDEEKSHTKIVSGSNHRLIGFIS